jgi:hypothetical protein
MLQLNSFYGLSKKGMVVTTVAMAWLGEVSTDGDWRLPGQARVSVWVKLEQRGRTRS